PCPPQGSAHDRSVPARARTDCDGAYEGPRSPDKPATQPTLTWTRPQGRPDVNDGRVHAGHRPVRLSSPRGGGLGVCAGAAPGWSVAGFGGDSGRVEDGDLSAGQADHAPVGELAQDLGGRFAGGADQRGELFVGQRDLGGRGSDAEGALLSGEG